MRRQNAKKEDGNVFFLAIFQHSTLYTSMCSSIHNTTELFLLYLTFTRSSISTIHMFLFLGGWLDLLFPQYMLSQCSAALVTAGAASKYLILFTQYWSRSCGWTCHETHNLYCYRACYATFWKAQGTESWWYTEVPWASCSFVFIKMFFSERKILQFLAFFSVGFNSVLLMFPIFLEHSTTLSLWLMVQRWILCMGASPDIQSCELSQ